MYREFLTGFRKRKLEKKKNAKEKFDKLVKQEKAEKRKEVPYKNVYDDTQLICLET